MGLPVIIIDTHGEYPLLLPRLIKDRISIEVYTVKHGRKGYNEFRIPVSNLKVDDFSHFMSLNENQKSALGLILDKLDGRDYQLKDIIDYCDSLDKTHVHEETANALKRRLSSLERIFRNVFDRYGTEIKNLIKPYQITVIDTSYAQQGIRQSVVSYIAKELLDGRIRNENEIDNSIEFPLLFVIEEAHNYASSNLTHSCKYQLRRIASEGRKFGIGLCVISQKPSKIDEEILSQCNTGIYMHITNPNDKEHIKRSFESINEEIIRDLDSLDVGECIIAGAMNRIPFLICKVDRIHTKEKERDKFGFRKPERVEIGRFDYV